MNSITLYTTHCPKCRVVEMKLKQKNIDFTSIEDVDEVVRVGKDHGINSAPILEVNGEFYDFMNAVKIVNSL